MLETLTAETFAPHVGSEFTASASGHEDVLTLIEIVHGRRPGPEGARAPFTLIFQGRRTDLRFEHMVRLDHFALGQLELGVVPLRRLPEGNFEYQAGFN
jgi:hypothetical protein